MTDLASLILSVDSTQVKSGAAALDGLTAAGRRAEGATSRLGRSNRTATAAASDLIAKTRLSSQAVGEMAARSQVTGGALTGMGGAASRAAASINVTRAASSAFSLLLGGTFATVIGAAIASLGILAFKHITGADAADMHRRATEELEKATLDLHNATIKEMRSTSASIQIDIDKANSLIARANAARQAAVEQLKLEKATLGANLAQANRFAGDGSGGTGARAGSSALAFGNAARTRALDADIARQERIIKLNTATANLKRGQLVQGQIEEEFDRSAAATGRYERRLDSLNAQLAGGRITLGKYRDEVRSARGAMEEAQEIADGGKAGRSRAGGRTSRASAHRDVAAALTDEQKAYQEALKAAQGYLAGLEGETARIGKTAAEIKQMEAAAAAAKAPTAELAQAIRDAGKAWVEGTNTQQVADFINSVIEPLEFENSLIDLNIEAQKKLRAERELTAAGVERGSVAWDRYLTAVQAATTAELNAANDNKSPFEQWGETIPKDADAVNQALESIALNGLDSLSTGIMDVINGTKSMGEMFSDIAQQIIADIIQMTIKMLLFQALQQAFGGGGGMLGSFGPFAKGGVFSGGNVVPFASGGIVGGPTMFPMSGGRTGLMGEAGPEAVMPLARDGQGRLGVRGGEGQRIVVQIDLDDEMLTGKIVKGANAVVEIRRPGLIRDAATATMRGANRRKLNG